jgi:DNA-binding MarR family transcriptional regulator
MRIFERLRALRAFEKRSLPFLKSLEDFDLVVEIGYHQERGETLTLKQLYLLGIGSIATVQRRLSVLKEMGVVLLKRSKEDARSFELTLSPKICKTYRQYGALLNRSRDPA